MECVQELEQRPLSPAPIRRAKEDLVPQKSLRAMVGNNCEPAPVDHAAVELLNRAARGALHAVDAVPGAPRGAAPRAEELELADVPVGLEEGLEIFPRGPSRRAPERHLHGANRSLGPSLVAASGGSSIVVSGLLRGAALGAEVAPVVRVEGLDKGRGFGNSLGEGAQVCAAHVQLQRDVGLLLPCAFQVATAQASQPEFGAGATFHDVDHVGARASKEPLHQRKLRVVVFQADAQHTQELPPRTSDGTTSTGFKQPAMPLQGRRRCCRRRLAHDGRRRGRRCWRWCRRRSCCRRPRSADGGAQPDGPDLRRPSQPPCFVIIGGRRPTKYPIIFAQLLKEIHCRDDTRTAKAGSVPSCAFRAVLMDA
mmetsp:Transcript_46398/g.148179  ORF Transcript_46398/g.148179 Transcript_46398/m.148179 type:complete len:367 (+) Transcript_46398:422-1522(+)